VASQQQQQQQQQLLGLHNRDHSRITVLLWLLLMALQLHACP
jgi:hypothetical protein